MIHLSVIIVNYNTKELLDKCISNLLEKDNSLEIIVVDNASTDGSAEMVETCYPKITLVKSENLGLSHGYNLGLSKATNSHILFLGTDAYPKLGCLEKCLGFLDNHSEVGAVTAKLVLRDGSLDLDAHRGFPTPERAFFKFSGISNFFKSSRFINGYFLGLETPLTGEFARAHEIELCISHFMMVKKEVFDKVGLWDENFFLYGEDVDMCYRIHQAGYKIFYLPEAECTHLKGASVGIRKETKDISKATPETKKRMRRETTKAMKLFYDKHYKNVYPTFVTWLVLKGISIMEFLRSRF